MDAIINFSIKKNTCKKNCFHFNNQEKIKLFYNKTKCNTIIITNDLQTKNSTNILKPELFVVMMREPNKYKNFVQKYKDILFNQSTNIVLFPNRYDNIDYTLKKFNYIFGIIPKNEIICKKLWITKMKNNYGCEVYFDYQLENYFNEEKVFENNHSTLYKFTLI
jgi:hypothetical protein